jgi:hypothetical protein
VKTLALVLVVLGLLACALSLYAFIREEGVRDTEARAEMHRQTAEQALADAASARNPSEAEELRQEAQQHAEFAESDITDAANRRTVAMLIGGVGVVCLAAGFFMSGERQK